MDDADPELGKGLWRAGDHVRRKDARITKAARHIKGKMTAGSAGALDMPEPFC